MILPFLFTKEKRVNSGLSCPPFRSKLPPLKKEKMMDIPAMFELD